MKNLIILTATALIFLPFVSNAQYGAISTATAGSGRASIEATEAPTLNPAAIPFSQGYFFTSDIATVGTGQEYAFSITDNLPDTTVPTSVIYSQLDGTTTNKRSLMTQDMHLAFGNIVTKTFAFGLAIEHKIDTVIAKKYFQTNLMMGTLFSLNQNLGLALVVENILPTDGSVPNDYRLIPTTAIGLSYNKGRMMRFKLDLETAKNNSFSQPLIAGGVETYWNRWVIFRIGMKKDFDINSTQYGGGIGFTGPKFAVHYGYLSSPESRDLARHSVDLAVPIW
jgi:hypothetical protein